MRESLITKIGNRKIFVGMFERYGFVNTATGRVVSTLLLVNVKSDGVVVTDHAWLTLPPDHGFEAFSRGDKVTFTARVVPYIRNCRERNQDIGFASPTKIRRTN